MFWTAVLTCLCVFCIWEWLKRKPFVGERHKKCVFITGCDSGFGNGLARRLDSKGVPVFAACFTESGVQKLKEQSSERLRTVLLDITNAASVEQAFQFVQENLPSDTELWGIVNNAGGGGRMGPLELMNRQTFRDVYELNLIGLMDVTQAFLPLLKKSTGRIVNCSSGMATLTLPNTHPYLTSKHGVRAFSSGLRAEKRSLGIKVSCVMPGGFNTPIANMDMIEAFVQNQWDCQPQHIKDEFGDGYVEKCMKLIRAMMKDAPYDVTPVVDAYEHALFAKSPRDEYSPGSEIWFHVKSFMPPMVMDYVMKYLLQKQEWFAPYQKPLRPN